MSNDVLEYEHKESQSAEELDSLGVEPVDPELADDSDQEGKANGEELEEGVKT